MSVDGEWRQMTFEDLLPGGRSETPSDGQRDEERSAAHESAYLGTTNLLEAVLDRDNLKRALRRVKKNRGSPGIDGMSVSELGPWLRDHWLEVKAKLLAGNFRPSAVRRKEILKSGGGVRKLGIPTVLDRFIQQAILQVLQPLIDPTFSDHSYGYRPGRSAHGAVRRAQGYIQEGRRVVVDVDLKSFFDRVNHDILMSRLAKRIADRRLLRLIRHYLESGVMMNGVVFDRYEGTPQGGPLSPLLANLLLDEVDQELERRGHAFVRYADDGQVYVRSHRAGQRVLALLRKLYRGLKLSVNESKTKITRALKTKLLGFSFWVKSRGVVECRVARETLDKMRDRVRLITKRNGGRSIESVIGKLRSFLIGWRGYFRLAETPRKMGELDGWIRRRLRALHLKQWKRGPTVFRELRNRGASIKLAADIAKGTNRYWWNASKRLQQVLNNSYFDELGLPRLDQRTSIQ